MGVPQNRRRGYGSVLAGGVIPERQADLEQAWLGNSRRLVVPDGFKQARENARAKMGVGLSHAVLGTHERVVLARLGRHKILGQCVADKAERDRFKIPAGDQGRTNRLNGGGAGIGLGQANRNFLANRHLVVTGDSRYFLDQIHFDVQIEAVTGNAAIDMVIAQNRLQMIAPQRIDNLRRWKIDSEDLLDSW